MSPNWLNTAKVSPCFKTRVRGWRNAPVASIRYCDSSSAGSFIVTAMTDPSRRRRSLGGLGQTIVGGKRQQLGRTRSAAVAQHPLIEREIVARHAIGRKELLEALA